MEPKLTRLQEEQLINSMLTNDATRRRTWYSLIISIAALVFSFVFSFSKFNPIESLFLWEVIAKSHQKYFFPYFVEEQLHFHAISFLMSFTIVAVVTIHSKFIEDYSLLQGIVKSWPIWFVWVISCTIGFLFKEPLPLAGFLFAICLAMILLFTTRWLLYTFYRMFTSEKYAHLRERRSIT